MGYEKGVSVSVGHQSTTYKDFEVIQVPVLLSDEFSSNVRCPPARDLASLLLAPKMVLLRTHVESIAKVLDGSWIPEKKEKESKNATSTSLDLDKPLERVSSQVKHMATDMKPLRVLIETSIATIDVMLYDLQHNNHTNVTKMHEMFDNFNKELEKARTTSQVRNTAMTLKRIRDLLKNSTAQASSQVMFLNNTNSNSSLLNSTELPDVNITLYKELIHEETYLEKFQSQVEKYLK